MSLISGFANQAVTLQSYTGKDGFGKPTYGSARTIMARKEPDRGVVRSATGTDVPVNTYYLTEETIDLQDKLDGVPIRRIREVIGKGGQLLGYEAWN